MLTTKNIGIERILKKQREEYQQYLGALAEDFTSHMKLIAETLSDVQKQLIDLREMVAKNTEDIGILKMEVQFMRRDLKQKADRDEVILLENRVAKLERLIMRK